MWRQREGEFPVVCAQPGGLPAASQSPKRNRPALINLAAHSTIADKGTPLSPWQMACLGLSKPSSHCLHSGFWCRDLCSSSFRVTEGYQGIGFEFNLSVFGWITQSGCFALIVIWVALYRKPLNSCKQAGGIMTCQSCICILTAVAMPVDEAGLLFPQEYRRQAWTATGSHHPASQSGSRVIYCCLQPRHIRPKQSYFWEGDRNTLESLILTLLKQDDIVALHPNKIRKYTINAWKQSVQWVLRPCNSFMTLGNASSVYHSSQSESGGKGGYSPLCDADSSNVHTKSAQDKAALTNSIQQLA